MAMEKKDMRLEITTCHKINVLAESHFSYTGELKTAVPRRVTSVLLGTEWLLRSPLRK